MNKFLSHRTENFEDYNGIAYQAVHKCRARDGLLLPGDDQFTAKHGAPKPQKIMQSDTRPHINVGHTRRRFTSL